MGIRVEIDRSSGFCGGVIRAVGRAEKFLAGHGSRRLYSIGAIVHNEAELARLGAAGLVTIDKEGMGTLPAGADVLFRAHGEPPSTYREAERLGLNVIDCTCPVVLKLQRDIREAYMRIHPAGGQIIIFGKVGHAEVLGLLGQVGGDAVVIEDRQMLDDALAAGEINLDGPVEIFSQTTKDPAGYAAICSVIEEAMAREHELPAMLFKGTGLLSVHGSICGQVSERHRKLSDFAMKHDIVIFVSGKDSSNGRVLFNQCKLLNIRTYHVVDTADVRPEWFRSDDFAGVCGATSTPKWLLESVAGRIRSFF